MKDPDRMNSSWTGWLEFFDRVSTLSETHAAMANELKEGCVDPLEKFHATGVEVSKDHKEHMAKLNNAMNEVKINIASMRNNCKKLVCVCSFGVRVSTLGVCSWPIWQTKSAHTTQM